MKISFHKKLFLYISSVMCMLMLLCVIIFSFYAYDTLKKQSESNLGSLSERVTTELQTLFDDMDKLSLYVSTNPSIMTAFMEAKELNYPNSVLSNAIIKTITSISIPNSSSRFRISLYNQNGNFISTGIPYSKNIVQEKLLSKEYPDWYESLPIINNNYNISSFHSDYWSSDDTLYISLYREIFDPYMNMTTTGIIEIQCPYSIVDDILRFQSDEYNCYLFDSSGKLIFPQKETKLSTEQLSQLYEENMNPTSHGSFSSLIYAGNLVNTEWNLITTQSQEHILLVLVPQILSVICMGFAALLLFLIMMFQITKYATQPLRNLTASVQEVSISNLSLSAIASDYKDEVSSLNRAFECMFDRLKQSMDENLRMKTYEMQANIVALQSQMNPHFLYNILTIIKALCREDNTVQIAITCDYLVKMMRYISDYDTTYVPLNKELNHTEHYLKLMKIRYEDQFSYTLMVDPSINVKTLSIPKLSLQPLVENCFQHGFQKVIPPWNITIHCWLKKNRWFLTVEDNGAGFYPADIEMIHQKIDEFLSNPSDALTSLKINGMGLVNTVARLKLAYKEQFTFMITNSPSGGSCVTLGGVLENEYITD